MSDLDLEAMNLTPSERAHFVPPTSMGGDEATKAWACGRLFWSFFDIMNDGPDDSDKDQATRYLQEAMKLARDLYSDGPK